LSRKSKRTPIATTGSRPQRHSTTSSWEALSAVRLSGVLLRRKGESACAGARPSVHTRVVRRGRRLQDRLTFKNFRSSVKVWLRTLSNFLLEGAFIVARSPKKEKRTMKTQFPHLR